MQDFIDSKPFTLGYTACIKAGLEEAVETVKKEAREVVLDRDTVEWLLKAITELDKGER